jgi:hypothetical protein
LSQRVSESTSWASLLLIGCLILGIFALHTYRFTDSRGGVPLDDAWIHFQFARNLARGDGFSFNPGQPTAGSTAPLWTLFLAAVYALGGPFPLAGQILSGACFLTTLIATYKLSQRLTDNAWANWLSGAVVAVNGRMVWAGLSALETCLFAALSLLALNAHLKDRVAKRYRLSTAVLFGLAALSRPEGYLLFALAMTDAVLYALRHKQHEISHVYGIMRHLLPPALLFAALVAPYLAFSLRTSGHLLPNTFHAKATLDLRPDLAFLSLWARYLILDNPLVLPFYVLGFVVLLTRARALSLWSIGLPLIYAFLHASLYQHGRYLMPLIPCNAVIGIVGLLEAGRLARRRGIEARFFLERSGPNLASRLTILLIVAGTAWRLPTMARQYARNVREINHMHVAIGQWVEQNTSPDAKLALNDIGAITYVSEREMVDLAGLVTPEVIPLLRSPQRGQHLINFLTERDVQYVIIFPNWFPSLAAREDSLTPVHQVTLEHRTIVGGEKMVIYQTDWQ